MTKSAISLGLLGGALGVAALTSTVAVVACSAKPQAPQVIQLAAADPAIKPPAPGGMSVTGSAVLEVAPDTADLTMTLTADASRPDTAASAVDKKEAELVAKLAKVGVEQADIKLSYVTLEPDYVYSNEPYAPPRLRGYHAAVTVTATTKAFVDIGAMMEAGTEAGATALTTSFRRSDISDLKKKVREMALAAAKDKAKQTAGALDIGLGRIVGVTETGAGIYNERVFPQSYQVANSVALAGVGGANGAGAAGVSLGATLQPLSIDITVSYELAR